MIYLVRQYIEARRAGSAYQRAMTQKIASGAALQALPTNVREDVSQSIWKDAALWEGASESAKRSVVQALFSLPDNDSGSVLVVTPTGDIMLVKRLNADALSVAVYAPVWPVWAITTSVDDMPFIVVNQRVCTYLRTTSGVMNQLSGIERAKFEALNLPSRGIWFTDKVLGQIDDAVLTGIDMIRQTREKEPLIYRD